MLSAKLWFEIHVFWSFCSKLQFGVNEYQIIICPRLITVSLVIFGTQPPWLSKCHRRIEIPTFVSIWKSLQWRHNGRDGILNHQPHDCLLNRLFRHRSKKTSKIRVTGLYAGNSPVTGEFPAQRASNAETVSIWWRHHAIGMCFDHIIFNKQEFML